MVNNNLLNGLCCAKCLTKLDKMIRKMFLLIILNLILIPLSKQSLAPGHNDRMKKERIEWVISELDRQYHEREFKRWSEHLGMRESGNNWKIINSIGCMGQYQFSPCTMRGLNFAYITPKSFASNPEIFPPDLQYRLLVQLVKSNEIALTGFFGYIGAVIDGVKVTKSGILAASHLAGAGGVIEFFTTGYIAIDKNGTTILDYLREFQGYDI